MSTPRASVVLATFGRDRELRDALASLLALPDDDFEVLVVDQSEHHDGATTAALRGPDPRLRYFRVAPPSLPAARNFGVERARGEIVVFVDDDVIVDPGFVAAHVAAHADSVVGAVVGRVREPSATPRDTGPFRLPLSGLARGTFDHASPVEVASVIGCNMSFRRAVLAQVGGFETAFAGAAHREETDVCERIRRAGLAIRFAPDASLVHLRAEAGGCAVRTDADGYPNAEQYRNEMLFFLRNRRLRHLPYFLVAQLHFWVLNRRTLKEHTVLRQLRRYGRGMAAGVWVRLRPRRTVARPLDDAPA